MSLPPNIGSREYYSSENLTINAAKYCSRECQKIAWPNHRLECRPSPTCPDPHPIYQNLGYPARKTVVDAIRDWSTLHEYAITVIVSIFVHLLAAELGRTVHDLVHSDVAMVITLNPIGREPLRESPADRFTWQSSLLKAKPDALHDEFGFTRAAWDAAEARRDRWAAHRPADAANVVGLFLTTTSVAGSRVSVAREYPVFRVRKPLGARDADVLHDVREVLSGLASTRLVARLPKQSRSVFPDVGHVVKEGREWVFAVEPRWNWSNSVPHYVVRSFKSRLSVPVLFMRFRDIFDMP
ncbi:uncharacterized protein BXZ73DRAFT_100265 [Epithele typhae]|uniref:uncharacterized protein n=1 Tax=Epithele typhae TaxID=378194 RepID=UPI002008B078|nr:uncharacterized protein BXZ73DRAFT_100265 [Epithele typhae]KAH9936846.1 hypothetical protein BXZ73DRAFT_100265 [Epithele typhae]